MTTKMNYNCPHKDRPHQSYGLCKQCYQSVKYYFYPKQMEQTKTASRLWFRRKCKENPNYNAIKQREFRKNNPISFYALMMRWYGKKLYSKDQKRFRQVLKEIRNSK